MAENIAQEINSKYGTSYTGYDIISPPAGSTHLQLSTDEPTPLLDQDQQDVENNQYEN